MTMNQFPVFFQTPKQSVWYNFFGHQCKNYNFLNQFFTRTIPFPPFSSMSLL